MQECIFSLTVIDSYYQCVIDMHLHDKKVDNLSFNDCEFHQKIPVIIVNCAHLFYYVFG